MEENIDSQSDLKNTIEISSYKGEIQDHLWGKDERTNRLAFLVVVLNGS